MKPISLAYSWKHWRQMFKPYFLMIPCPLEQARLEKKWNFFINIFWGYGKCFSNFHGFSLDFLAVLDITLTNGVILVHNFLDERTKRERNPWLFNFLWFFKFTNRSFSEKESLHPAHALTSMKITLERRLFSNFSPTVFSHVIFFNDDWHVLKNCADCWKIKKYWQLKWSLNYNSIEIASLQIKIK